MELDSEDLTPPSSPLLGYSGSQDEQSLIDSGVVYCLNCKGVPRLNDYSFSPESYILRREVICAVDNLKPNVNSSFCQDDFKPRLIKCFNGHLFDLLETDQLKTLVAICRKTIDSLEVLSEASNSLNFYNVRDADVAANDPEELRNQNPWMLRKQVCHFLNLIVRKLRFYRTIGNANDFENFFIGLKKSLALVKNWSSVLKSHCGARNGNDCTSATYHFFHLQLELRWSLFLIFGMKESLIQWILDDLIHLSWSNYSNEGNIALDDRQPFNCTCVKEIWVMIRLLIDELQPQQKTFWDFYSEAVKKIESDHFFPIWLTTHLSQSSNYSAAGTYSLKQPKDYIVNGSSKYGYKFLREAFKEWGNRGGKSVEIVKLCFEIFKNWGGDGEIISSLWMQWIPRLDKGNDFSNFHSFDSIDNWLSLISKVGESTDYSCNNGGQINDEESYLSSIKDPFFHLVRLVSSYVKSCSEKEFKRFKSNLCMRLNKASTETFGELGIIRVSAMFLVIASVINSAKEALSLCERLQSIFTYEKGRRTTPRLKAILRVYAVMNILLLQKKLDIKSASSVTNSFMKIIDELLSHPNATLNSSGDLSHKELIMIYLEMLELIPKRTPPLSNDSNLQRHILISSNFLMWLSNCGNNYLIRTADMLSQMTSWIVTWSKGMQYDPAKSSFEAKDLLGVISERCMSYIKNCVLQQQHRIPSTDIKPIANFAGDVAILTLILKGESEKMREECTTLFDLFTLCYKTCPVVSQYFVERLFSWSSSQYPFLENTFPLIKWAQVWIRLIALDCVIPDRLTEMILGHRFASTSNRELLEYFCKSSQWRNKDDMQQIFRQLTEILKDILNGTYVKDEEGEAELVVHSVITTCTFLLNNVPFSLIYIRGLATSVAHQFYNYLVPPPWPGIPPWEKFSKGVMRSLEENLYDLFHSVVSYSGCESDDYMKRKLQDIVFFAVFGFLNESNEVNSDENPAVRILKYCESQNVTLVQKEILPNVISGDRVVNDLKLYPQFIRAVHIVRVKGLATSLLRMGAGVIKIYLRHKDISKSRVGLHQCLSAVVACCMFGSTPTFKQLAIDAFENAFRTDFDFRSQRCFDLCVAVTKNNTEGRKRNAVKLFVKQDILPLLDRLVAACERKRASGYDSSLRNRMDILRSDLQDVDNI